MAAVTQDVDAAGIATVTINRPEALNALNADVLDGLESSLRACRGKAKAIVLTGAGKAFVAGADISQMSNLDAAAATQFARRGQAVAQLLSDFPGPVIAAVNGYALGGGLELAMACDIIVASEKAVVGQPEVKLGVVPGFGGSQRLPRRTGPGIAKMLLMTGESVKADEALRMGIVDKVVAPDQLLGEARRVAEAALQNGPQAIALAKRLVQDGLDVALPTALALEAEAFGQCFATQDQKEGMKAFLEKRKANFKGQ